MSHCDPISHGTANSPEKKKQAESVEMEQGERINKEGRIKRRKQEETEDHDENDARKAVIRATDGSAEPRLG